MDEMNTDWIDEFDDSVLDDTIEANDSSALTGFDNTETEAETSSPLEAESAAYETPAVTSTSEDVTQSSDDFFKYFTPTISRSAGPSSMSNDAHSKGGKPAGGTNNGDDDKDIDLNDYYGGGKTDGDDPDDKGGYGSNWNDDGDSDIDLNDYYGGGKTDGDDDSDDDYGSWTDKDRAEAAKEVADAAGNESAKEAAAAELADKEYKDLMSKSDDKLSKVNAARDKHKDALKEYRKTSETASNVNFDNVKDGKTVTLKDGEVTYWEYTGTNSAEKAAIDARNEAIDRLVEATAEHENAKKDFDDYVASLRAAKSKSKAAKEKAKEALAKAQAAKENAGTLAGEANEAYERAKEKQKKWEQKQKDGEANEKDGGASNSNSSNSAVNNPATFDLAKTLADSGAKMTEKEYGQVADFVAAHPELASIINGGLTNAEKHTIGNVIAGIQAINEGNYLTAVKEFAQGFGMTLVSAVQLISSGIYGAGARIAGIIKSFMENPNIKYDGSKDFKTFKEMRDEYDGDSSELMAIYKTSKGTTDQKQTFDYMKDNAATNVGEYNEGLVEDVNKVVSDASRKIIHYSPYVLEAVKKWR